MCIIPLFIHFLERAMAPHSSTLAWGIPWAEEPGGLHPWGHKESDMTERLHFHFSLSCIGERDGSPLQCSCLENPRDGGAWWTAIYGVVQSRTRLKWLGSIHFLIYLKCFNFFQNALDKNFILTYLDAPTFDFIYISLWKFSRQTLFLLEYVQLDICFKISSKHLFLCYQTWVLCTGW